MSPFKVVRLATAVGFVLWGSSILAEPPSGPSQDSAAARDAASVEADAVAAAPLNPYVPPACTGVFTDVACPGGFAVNWIEKFYADGITSGCNAAPLEYCPDASVTRAQMAVFVERAMRGTGAWSPGDLGTLNTGLGAGALLNNSPFAQHNTAVGTDALLTQSYDNGGTSWNTDNTALGYSALYANQPYNGFPLPGGFGNTAAGSLALVGNTSGYGNTALGMEAGSANTTGVENVAVGVSALFNNATGNLDTAVGAGAGMASDGFINATALGANAVVDATDHVRIGDTSVTQIGGQVGWSNLSDARAKNDIRDLDLGLGFVMALRPVSFTMKSGNGRTDMGFVAQDVEHLVGDEYNVLGIGGDADRTLSLRYTDLIAPMVKAIQEQQATIEAQRAALAALKPLQAEVAALRAALSERAERQSQVEALAARVARLEAAAAR